MISDATPTPASDQKQIARNFLKNANKEYQVHRKARTHWAAAARAFGLTNQDIADQYGITEGAVRAMIRRAGK